MTALGEGGLRHCACTFAYGCLFVRGCACLCVRGAWGVTLKMFNRVVGRRAR